MMNLPNKVASSENGIKRTYCSPETKSFVKRVNKDGDNTHHCRAIIMLNNDWGLDTAVDFDDIL